MLLMRLRVNCDGAMTDIIEQVWTHRPKPMQSSQQCYVMLPHAFIILP